VVVEKKGKRTGVSRRDFLKGLGGGAVGTAIVSAGLLKPDRVEGASPRSQIPFPRNSQYFTDIENHLRSVLGAIKGVAGRAEVLWVSCRLNKTGAQGPEPVFAGWVEGDAARGKRFKRGYPNPPIDTHFGGLHVSDLYRACFKAPVGEVVKKHWNGDKASPGSLELGRKYYEETHRRSMPIKIDKDYVGTLNVGFSGDPAPVDQKIKTELQKWAQDSKSPLVTYLSQNLAVSRQRHP
jgi:hypothetical protein